MKQSLFFTILLFLFYSCAGTENLQHRKAKNHKELCSQIETIFNDSAFAHAHWGASIKSLKTGKILYKQNDDKLFLPASNTKIPTSANTFLELGTDFYFETMLYSDAEIQDSILIGNLYVKGTGDPTLYEEFYDSTTAVFFDWATILKFKGIKSIQGDIIGDESAFDESRLGYGWVFDNFDTWYSAEFGPLQINENYVDITIFPPATSEDSTRVFPNISSSYFSIIDKTVLADTGKSDISVRRKFGTNDIEIKGTLVIGGNKIVRSPSITNPGLFFTTVLKETFQRNGISVLGSTSVFSDTLRSDSLLMKSDTLLLHFSPDGQSIISKLMKRSQNMYAETMPRFVTYQKTGHGTFDKWLEIIEPNMEKMGIKKGSYQYADGSGLARYNYFSPNQFRSILEYMYYSPYKEKWLEVFPIAGVDGTLKRRMIGTSAENNVRAKTGTISNSRGLSGYVTSKSGEEFAFSFLVNGHILSSSDTDRITDSILTLIAEFDR